MKNDLHETVDLNQWLFWSNLYELACYKHAEAQYQDFFVKIMQLRHGPAFSAVMPWGNVGDLHCDGYLADTRTVFQVYAPRSFRPISKAKHKIQGNHEGAVVHWRQHMDTWALVHNCEATEGLPAPIVKLLAECREKVSEIKVEDWGRETLKAEVRRLSATQLTELLGQVPSGRQTRRVSQHDLHRVIESLSTKILVNAETGDVDVREVPPDKMDFNKLDESIRQLLTTGFKNSQRVRHFFDNDSDAELGTRIAEAFAQKYQALKERALRPKEIFYELQLFAGFEDPDPAIQVAALSVLAYLFETCHIFERPTHAASDENAVALS